MKNGKLDENFFNIFRKICLEIDLNENDKKLCEDNVLFTKIYDNFSLSPFGVAVADSILKEIYSLKLFPPPIDKIIYSKEFEKVVNSLEKDRIAIINERIDDFTKYIKKGENINRLGFKRLKGNPTPPSTHEIDAWADKDAKRIFLHKENEVWILDKIDKGFH